DGTAMGVELLARHQLDRVHPALGVGQLHEVADAEGPVPAVRLVHRRPAACNAATRSSRDRTPQTRPVPSTTRYSVAGVVCTASTSASPFMSVRSTSPSLTGRARSLT